ncbi:MAG: protein translocase subunit SecF [Candidatus Paceibacterota bacterium]
MWIIKYTKIWLIMGALLVLASIASIAFFGLQLGPDFVGGRTIDWEISSQPDLSGDALKQSIIDNGQNPRAVTKNDNIFKIELEAINEEEYTKLKEAIAIKYDTEDISKADIIKEKSNILISSSVGNELKNRSLIAIIVVLITIILFMIYVFRGISYPVPSRFYGFTAIVALFHDIVIPTGIFAYLSYRGILQIDVLFIIALLSILGSSVNDTIVVFDRIRENVRRYGGDNFEEIVGKSIDQSLARSINTSLSLLVVLGGIFLYGGASVQYFALALFLGIFFGTYSSIFIASPLLVVFYKLWYKKA